MPSGREFKSICKCACGVSFVDELCPVCDRDREGFSRADRMKPRPAREVAGAQKIDLRSRRYRGPVGLGGMKWLPR